MIANVRCQWAASANYVMKEHGKESVQLLFCGSAPPEAVDAATPTSPIVNPCGSAS